MSEARRQAEIVTKITYNVRFFFIHGLRVTVTIFHNFQLSIDSYVSASFAPTHDY